MSQRAILGIGKPKGAMMAQMMSDAHIDYPYWYGGLYLGGSSHTRGDTGNFGGDPNLGL